MRKVKIKLNYDEFRTLINLIIDQVITAENKWFFSDSWMAKACLTEIVAKHQSKLLFAFEGTRTLTLSVAQAYAMIYAIQDDWFETDNQWVATILQLNHDRIHKQLQWR